MIYRLIGVVAVATTIASCATVFSGPSDKVTFTSDPPDIKIYKDTRLMGETPMMLEVKRVGFADSQRNVFRFEKDGYKPQTFELETEFNRVSFWNSTSVFSYLTDAFSGSITRYSPTDYHVILEPVDLDDKTAFIRSSNVQKLILTSYYELQEEIALGEGEHLRALLSVLNIRPDETEEFLALVRLKMLPNKTASEFMLDLNLAMLRSESLSDNAFL